MSKRVLDSPEIEAKDLFYRNRDNDLFENFFEDASPPDGVSKDDYLKELKIEYYNLKIEEARRSKKNSRFKKRINLLLLRIS